MTRTLTIVGATFLFASTILTLWEAISRYLFSWSNSWGQEVATLLVVYAVSLFAGVVIVEGGHISLTALTDKLSPRIKNTWLIIADFIGIAFSLIITWYGIVLTNQALLTGQTNASGSMPHAVIYLSVPITFIFMVIYYLIDIGYRWPTIKEATDK